MKVCWACAYVSSHKVFNSKSIVIIDSIFQIFN